MVNSPALCKDGVSEGRSTRQARRAGQQISCHMSVRMIKGRSAEMLRVATVLSLAVLTWTYSPSGVQKESCASCHAAFIFHARHAHGAFAYSQVCTWKFLSASCGMQLRGIGVGSRLLSGQDVCIHAAPRSWRVRQIGVAAASMKEGAIGRGRGAMSPEQFEQAQKQIETAKNAPAKSPEEHRRSSQVVGAVSHPQRP